MNSADTGRSRVIRLGMVIIMPVVCFLAATYFYLHPPGRGTRFDYEVRTRYYDLKGDNRDELFAQMRLKGPIDPADGNRYFGFTTWHVNWHFDTSQNSDRYWIGRADVTLTINTSLPKRIASQAGDFANDRFLSEWTRYSGALRYHESGHSQNATSCAREIFEKLTEPRTFASRHELDEYVSSETRRSLQKANQADIDYDKSTKHGTTQGACLNP